jgi:hypothetical protein
MEMFLEAPVCLLLQVHDELAGDARAAHGAQVL